MEDEQDQCVCRERSGIDEFPDRRQGHRVRSGWMRESALKLGSKISVPEGAANDPHHVDRKQIGTWHRSQDAPG